MLLSCLRPTHGGGDGMQFSSLLSLQRRSGMTAASGLKTPASIHGCQLVTHRPGERKATFMPLEPWAPLSRRLRLVGGDFSGEAIFSAGANWLGSTVGDGLISTRCRCGSPVSGLGAVPRGPPMGGCDR